ncbi:MULTISPECIES: phosphopentomutase [unclassified Paenibacillus]|uniref:phosphopentomutase n=1 Tax=unclassified Paenibacillus TaxID=185978 RepID=UPI001AEAF91E|nr:MULTISPECIES: phosphopentomutase [unclassified Paenibacillus]MBP1155173.1 phosphopentomutase [Paenibacillus sp. PvP091]MBP1169443.1 phosphopentomutase [Paenibacillus sp. PvR098]MBP2440471.1 phosphopentomutase [Paenibacillus sp. PvP052]
MKYKRIAVIVLDSVGIGELPDAARFGDTGSHTLGHIAERVPSLRLPHMQQLGLGNIVSLQRIPPVEQPAGYYGKMAEVSVGKDTMTGHWEIMGLKVDIPFNVFPDGFPAELIERFEKETGRKVLGNKPASGTEILDELGAEQMATGAWILYTSADSVLQLAAHEEIIPLEELYSGCEIARRLTLEEPYAVGRVIARPYIGKPGAFTRTSNRHDYAVKPPAPTVMNLLKDAGLDSISVGKINDIFSGEGITESNPTKSNLDGIHITMEKLSQPFEGLLFTNLVDFDSLYGHRRDPEGYAKALNEFDDWLPKLMERIGEDDLLILTADHGNDPVHPGTDHTREYVPLLVYNPAFQAAGSLGIRHTFADIAATIADNFEVTPVRNGTSFLRELQ